VNRVSFKEEPILDVKKSSQFEEGKTHPLSKFEKSHTIVRNPKLRGSVEEGSAELSLAFF